MPTIKITIDGDEFSFTKTPTGVVFQFTDGDPVEIPNVVELWGGAQEGMLLHFIKDGDDKDRALFKTWLFHNAPYMEFIDEAPILSLVDEIVLHLLDKIPGLPVPVEDLHLTIDNAVLSKHGDGHGIGLPTTGTEALSFNPGNVYSQLVVGN